MKRNLRFKSQSNLYKEKENNEWRSIQKSDKDLVNTSLKAYPNPASNLVNYSYDLGDIKPEGTLLEIMDFMGRIIQELTIVLPNGNITWDCTFVPTGVYYYRIVKNKEEIIKPKSVIVIK
jgi:Secretion system C-terminal sorting domain